MMQSDNWIESNIAGAKRLIDWFGYWPSFHDAEIIEIHLTREGRSWLKIHTWHTSDEVDSQNHFATDKDVVVRIELQDIQELELSDFSHQNVIFGLDIRPVENGIELTLEPCFGLSGRLVASKIGLEILPGDPKVR